MRKVLLVLVALVAFAAIPSVGYAQGNACDNPGQGTPPFCPDPDPGTDGTPGAGGAGGQYDDGQYVDNGNGAGVTLGRAGVGGGDVGSVELAKTGYDVSILALVGGFAIAGGLGLVALQRRRVTS